MTVSDLLSRISSAELSEWMAFSNIEPFGEVWDDFRTGTLASLIANVNRDPKKIRKQFEPSDFFVTLSEPKEVVDEEPWEKQLRQVEVLNMLFGGIDKRKM